MLGVGIEGGRLGREWILSRRRDFSEFKKLETLRSEDREGKSEEVGEKEVKVRKREAAQRWWREVWTNAAWAPLTAHWSIEKGMLGEGTVGALGMVAGGLTLREAWMRG